MQRSPSGLIIAVQRGTKAEVQRLLRRKCPVDEADSGTSEF